MLRYDSLTSQRIRYCLHPEFSRGRAYADHIGGNQLSTKVRLCKVVLPDISFLVIDQQSGRTFEDS